MKKIAVFLIGLVMSLGLSSCVTTVQAEDGVYNDGIDVTVVVRYGTPVFVDDMIAYYVYNGWYYYPYYIGNRYYFHRYSRVLPPERLGHRYRPIPRDYRHPRPDAHHRPGHVRPDAGHRPAPQSQNRRSTPNINNNRGGRPQGGATHSRPMSPQRSSTRGGNFGGRR